MDELQNRARLHGRDSGARGQILGCPDPEKRGKLSHRRGTGNHAQGDHPGLWPSEEGRRHGKPYPEAGENDPGQAQRHQLRLQRDHRGQLLWGVSPGGLADRLRHPVQYERQRGHCQSGQRLRRRKVAPSQRRCEYVPVLQRHLPHRHAHCGGAGCGKPGDSRSGCVDCRICPAGRGKSGNREMRTHPLAGCHPHHLLPGDFRLAHQFGAGPDLAEAGTASPA